MCRTQAVVAVLIICCLLTGGRVLGYTLTVNSGSGDGSYSESQVVDITADAAASGKFFDAWTGDTSTIADINDPSTTITMPGSDAEITATYTWVASGLVSRYTFDIDARDTYGNNDGTLSGATVSNDGTRGKVLSLDGSNDYVSLPSSGLAGGRSEVTLSLWIKPDETTGSNTIYDEENNWYWQFSVRQDKWYTRDSSTGTTGSRNNDLPLPGLSSGQWQHLAFVYSVSGGEKTIYIDGEESTSTSTSIDQLTSDRTNQRIGWPSDGDYFDGLVDDMRLYSRALSSSEIELLAEVEYTLTVNSGTGDGDYMPESVVDIAADTAPSGKQFDQWMGDTEGIASLTSASTTLTMPYEDAEITATYTDTGTTKLSVSEVTASGYEDPNVPSNTLDENLGTRWSESGYTGVWIKYDLGSAKTVSKVYIAWYLGDTRTAYFDIEGSTNDSDYSMLYDDGESSGTTTDLEEYDFTDTTARYIRINGYGNSSNHWNSLTEVEIHGPSGATYTLTVNSGTGDGDYSESQVADISADTAPSGQEFDDWVGDTSGIANVNASSTTLTMPAANQEVTATYTDKKWALTVNSGTGDGDYVVGTEVPISADTPPSGQEFDEWVGDVSGVANVNASSTTLTMPYADAEVTATYTDKKWTLTVNSGSGDGDYVVGRGLCGRDGGSDLCRYASLRSGVR